MPVLDENNGGQITDVLFRDETRAHSRKLERRERDQPDIDEHNDPGHTDESAGYVPIVIRQPFEALVETTENWFYEAREPTRLNMTFALMRL